jgi:hypothetical protein
VSHDVAGDALGSVSHVKGGVLGHAVRCTLGQIKHQRNNLQETQSAGQIIPIDAQKVATGARLCKQHVRCAVQCSTVIVGGDPKPRR